MARKSRGDRILESRHLVGLFLGVVLLCGVFFTLGYVMGRTQYGGAVQASNAPAKGDLPDADAPEANADTPPPKAKTTAAQPSPSASEWDFYSKKDNNHLEPAASPAPAVVESPAPATVAQPVPTSAHVAVRSKEPKFGKGTLVLQLAALSHESDALAMADALQAKRFPSFVVAPSADKLYRVQVGPYPNEQKAEAAKAALDHAGFKAIIKR